MIGRAIGEVQHDQALSDKLREICMLIISAKRGKWRDKGGIESADKEFATRRPQIVSRDGGRCRFCNAKLEKMHVHHKDDDHSNNQPSNLMTTDELCHAVNHVGLLGKAGHIVYLPSISQEDISHLTRAIIVVIARGGKDAEDARQLARYLIATFTEPVVATFGSDSPVHFGNALLQLSDSSYNNRTSTMKDVRVLFDVAALSKGAGSIAKSLYPKAPDDIVGDWRRIADDIETRAGMQT